jgi:hypothetical protein
MNTSKKQILNFKNIIDDLKKNNINTKSEKIDYFKKYKYVKEDYSFLYNIIIEHDLYNEDIFEIKMLNMMLTKLDEIIQEPHKKTEKEKEIGQVLVDKYVTPLLDKDKN